MSKVVHLTSAHDRFDARIFSKMCSSLAKLEEFEVTLIVADGLGDEIKNGIQIVDVGKSKSRLSRMFVKSYEVVKSAVELKADVYHFHDPEILLWIKQLRATGARIVYDVHEDLPRQLLSKPYLSPILLRFLSKGIEIFENWKAKKCDLIVTVTPTIQDRFLKIHNNVCILANFPLFNEFNTHSTPKENYICYVGGITRTRGIFEMLELAKKISVPLKLAGPVETEETLNLIMQSTNTEYLGILNRSEVAKLISKAKIGLCILHPITNYIVAYPIKVFEYMAARTPVIASNFPLWKEIVEGNNCGICVDPFDKLSLIQSINNLISNKTLADEMGDNGYKAVTLKYNWTSEEAKLFSLYKNLTNNEMRN